MRRSRFTAGWIVATGLWTTACTTGPEPSSTIETPLPSAPGESPGAPGESPGALPVPPSAAMADPASGSDRPRRPLPAQPPRFIPTDVRETRTAERPPVAISGGTLLATADGRYALAADPDRDRVSVVDLSSMQSIHDVALQVGDEPGRMVEGASGQVHVALRRGGAVISIDPDRGEVIARHTVCGSPRGIAYDAATDSLRVACADGVLLRLTLPDGQITSRSQLTPGLRDIILEPAGLFVSDFKRAELVRLDASDALLARTRPLPSHSAFPEAEGSERVDALEPEVAWRTVRGPGDSLLMLHQGARQGSIDIESAKDPQRTFNPYGSGSCNGVVQTVLSLLDASGQPQGSLRIEGSLAVDVAVSPRTGLIAVAHAGRPDPDQPRAAAEAGATFVSVNPVGVTFFREDDFSLGVAADERQDRCQSAPSCSSIQGAISAVTFAPDGRLLAQRREPAELLIAAPDGSSTLDVVALGGTSVADTGHDIFHLDTGAGIACASCHPEGGEDGHIWDFAGVGPRRTQALHVGLQGTAPFHWEGDLPDIASLLEEVLVQRMGGAHESPARTAALETWLYTLQPPAAQRPAEDPAALRGRQLFENEAECSTCHAGPKLTNNKSEDVGTGARLQVPSLIAIGQRAPFMHTGCAQTLLDRFTPECGGETHGKTAALAPEQLQDLVAYLESL